MSQCNELGRNPEKQQKNEDDNSMEKYFKYLMVQRQLDHDERREEQRIKREEQEQRREEQERLQEKRREEQELRREDKRLRHEQQLNMMQMMMLGFLGGQRNIQQQMPMPELYTCIHALEFVSCNSTLGIRLS